jgi:hypothetical protein
MEKKKLYDLFSRKTYESKSLSLQSLIVILLVLLQGKSKEIEIK